MTRPHIVEVAPPSTWTETGLVVRGVFLIAYFSAILIGLARIPSGGRGAPASLQYDEIAFGALRPDEQRVCRLLREGIAAAERVRGRVGRWPPVEELAARGVAPFADPIDRAHYKWTRVGGGTVLDYVGVPDASSGMPTLAVVILEPEPGTPKDPSAVADDVHHVLPDKTMVHVSVWMAPGARPSDGPMSAPRPEDGWRRVITMAN